MNVILNFFSVQNHAVSVIRRLTFIFNFSYRFISKLICPCHLKWNGNTQRHKWKCYATVLFLRYMIHSNIDKFIISQKAKYILEYCSCYRTVIKIYYMYNEETFRYWTCLIWANFLLTFKDRIWFKFEMWLALFDVSLMSANLEVCSFAWYWKLWLTQVLSILWKKICSA